MVRIRNLLFIVLVFWGSYGASAQLIRKDHREMTPSEKITFRDAVIARRNVLISQANHHANHFETEIHTRISPINGTQFQPWHRIFLLEIEELLRTSGVNSTSDKITFPYWDWRVENDISNVTWDDSGFLDLTTLNSNGFAITRGSMTAGAFNLATNTNINSMMGLSNNLPSSFENASPNSSFFSKRLESWHNGGHNFIGGTMGQTDSPRDPIFYLHHNFVDKLWQDWEDKESVIKSSFPSPPSAINDWPATNPNSITDSRSMTVNLNLDNFTISRIFEVWFAANRKLLLDGLNGNFNTNSTGTQKKTYCYVAWNGTAVEGTIYAGDVQRDANDNIIADTKGGFVVDGLGADFYAGKSIELRPGFRTVLGAPFSAQIVDKPCGYTSNNFTSDPSDDSALFLKSKTDTDLKLGEGKAYPNPFTSELNISYNIETDTPLSIELVNTLGQSVWKQNYGQQSKGVFNTIIPAQDLAKGLYHVLIRTAKNQVTLKVIR